MLSLKYLPRFLVGLLGLGAIGQNIYPCWKTLLENQKAAPTLLFTHLFIYLLPIII